MTENGIHKALDQAEVDSDRYWALIEYLDYYRQTFIINLEKGGHIAYY